jgi:hypothetical protein
MPLPKDLFTVRRAAIGAALVVAVVAPATALRALAAKPGPTTVDVALRPVAASGTTTIGPVAPSTTTGAGSMNPFGSTTVAPTTVPAAPVTVVTTPPPVTTTAPPPPSGPGNASSYAFATYPGIANKDTSPVRWSSSATMHYLISPANAPAGALADLTLAIGMVQASTGLKFVYDGQTSVPTDNAAACTPATATTCWFDNPKAMTPPLDGTGGFPPVLIGWSPASAPIIGSGSPVGRTFVLPRPTAPAPSVPNDFELVSGIVVFNSTVALPGGFGGSSRGVAMLHGLGGLMGLTMVTDPDQMMFSALNGHVAAYGAGDLAGLKLAGRGVSYPVIHR